MYIERVSDCCLTPSSHVVSSFIKDGNHDRNEILSKVIINTNKEVFITPRKNHANTI